MQNSSILGCKAAVHRAAGPIAIAAFELSLNAFARFALLDSRPAALKTRSPAAAEKRQSFTGGGPADGGTAPVMAGSAAFARRGRGPRESDDARGRRDRSARHDGFRRLRGGAIWVALCSFTS